MAFNRIAENKIREAMAEGKFDNLPGAGEPIDLEGYFSAPEDLRMAYSILKSARCAPTEVELLNEITRLQAELMDADDPAARHTLQQTLANRRTELAILLERRSRRDR
jgi:Domain of unknown function (DUF1992)